MKNIFKTLGLMLFGFACGGLGQFGYYAGFMKNPVVLLIMLVIGTMLTVLLSED